MSWTSVSNFGYRQYQLCHTDHLTYHLDWLLRASDLLLLLWSFSVSRNAQVESQCYTKAELTFALIWLRGKTHFCRDDDSAQITQSCFQIRLLWSYQCLYNRCLSLSHQLKTHQVKATLLFFGHSWPEFLTPNNASPWQNSSQESTSLSSFAAIFSVWSSSWPSLRGRAYKFPSRISHLWVLWQTEIWNHGALRACYTPRPLDLHT